jgi:hypothetical protein
MHTRRVDDFGGKRSYVVATGSVTTSVLTPPTVAAWASSFHPTAGRRFCDRVGDGARLAMAHA